MGQHIRCFYDITWIHIIGFHAIIIDPSSYSGSVRRPKRDFFTNIPIVIEHPNPVDTRADALHRFAKLNINFGISMGTSGLSD